MHIVYGITLFSSIFTVIVIDIYLRWKLYKANKELNAVKKELKEKSFQASHYLNVSKSYMEDASKQMKIAEKFLKLYSHAQSIRLSTIRELLSERYLNILHFEPQTKNSILQSGKKKPKHIKWSKETNKLLKLWRE